MATAELKPTSQIQLVSIKSIRIDKDALQPREASEDDVEVRRKYAADMMDGDEFPPITVFDDGADLWLSDGHTRVDAAKSIGCVSIKAKVIKGTKRDAILFAIEVNRIQGRQMTLSDCRKAAVMLLRDTEWRRWNNAMIARKSGISSKTVAALRQELAVDAPGDLCAPRLRMRRGKVEVMKVRTEVAEPTVTEYSNGSRFLKVPGTKTRYLRKSEFADDVAAIPCMPFGWTIKAISKWLAKHQIAASQSDGDIFGGILSGGNWIARVEKNLNQANFADCVGQAVIAKHRNKKSRCFVLCLTRSKSQGMNIMIQFAAKAGVEVCTPQQFVERIKSLSTPN